MKHRSKGASRTSPLTTSQREGCHECTGKHAVSKPRIKTKNALLWVSVSSGNKSYGHMRPHSLSCRQADECRAKTERVLPAKRLVSQQFGYKNVVFRMFSLGLTWSDPNKKRWCVFLEIQSDIQLNTSINPLQKLQNLPHNRRVFKFYFISKSSSESCLHIHEHVGNGNR